MKSQVARKQGKLVAIFVDHRATFDSVGRRVLEVGVREKSAGGGG